VLAIFLSRDSNGAVFEYSNAFVVPLKFGVSVVKRDEGDSRKPHEPESVPEGLSENKENYTWHVI